MRPHINTLDNPSSYFVYLNGRPVDAVAADNEEGWVDLVIRDRHNQLIEHLGPSLELVTARAKGFVQIIKRDNPPMDWHVDMALADTLVEEMPPLQS